MSQFYQILMAGTGGQGLVSMASSLAKAAIEEGKRVVQTQSYGVAQRGGFVSAEVLISDQEILYQQVRKPSIILVLHGVVGQRYDQLNDVPVLYDSTLIADKALSNWHPVPFTQLAMDLGNVKTTNMLGLGALARVMPLVSLASLEAVARASFKGAVADLNVRACQLGYEAAGNFAAKRVGA